MSLGGKILFWLLTACVTLNKSFSWSACLGSIAGADNPLRALSTSIRRPTALARPKQGAELYFVASGRVFAALQDGSVIAVAGNGTRGYCGEHQPAASSCLSPTHIAVDAWGDLLIADYDSKRVLKVHMDDGSISTFAGNGQSGFCGEGGLAVDACISPGGLSIDDTSNSVYIADIDNNRVRKVLANGTIITVAGSGVSDFCGDGGPATSACLSNPQSALFTGTGELLIADTGNYRVRVCGADGVISTLAGDGEPWLVPLHLGQGHGDNTLITDYANEMVFNISSSGLVQHIIGSGLWAFCGDGGPAIDACIGPVSTMLDESGNILVADMDNNRIRKVYTENATISTIIGVGQYCGDGGIAGNACFDPWGVALNEDRDIFIADMSNHRIRRVSAQTGLISTIAGTGSSGFCGDGGPATRACLSAPLSVTVDGAGNVLIADYNNNRVRKVDMVSGIITTIVGSGSISCSPTSASALHACISVSSMVFDSTGNLFIADYDNNYLWMVDMRQNTITVKAGNGDGAACGNPQSPTSACIKPWSLAVDVLDNIVIADFDNNLVYLFAPLNNSLTVLAGDNTYGFCGDGGAAATACIASPTGVATDAEGAIYIADYDNSRIRKIFDGIITTVAGSGALDTCPPDAKPLDACFAPAAITVGVYGNIFIADAVGYAIRATNQGEPLACPAGYACPCATPKACNASDVFCPGNTRHSYLVSPGYFTQPEGDGLPRSQQKRCTRGSYCVDGLRFLCPAGTFGSTPGQVTPTSCIACPIGTYSNEMDASHHRGCINCPDGAVASKPSSSFCSWCPPDTYRVNNTCAPCPYGTYSLGAAASCEMAPNGFGVVTWDTFASLSPISSTKVSLAETTSENVGVWVTPLPIILLASLPALYVVMVKWWQPDAACHESIKRRLRRIDLFGLHHRIKDGQSPVLKRTTLGGAATVLSLGCIIAIAAALVAQYSLNNAAEQKPIMAPVLDEYAALPPMSASPSFTGIMLTLSVMGARCANISWAASNVIGNAQFDYFATTDNRSLHTRHSFSCSHCAFRAISTLDVHLAPECNAFHVEAAAVGAAGSVTRASFQYHAPCSDGGICQTNVAVAVAFPLTLEVVNDDAKGTSVRGFGLSVAHLTSTGAVQPGSAILRVGLPLANTYIIRQVSSITTAAQLASSIIGLGGLLAAFGKALSVFEAACANRCSKKAKLGSQLGRRMTTLLRPAHNPFFVGTSKIATDSDINEQITINQNKLPEKLATGGGSPILTFAASPVRLPPQAQLQQPG